MNWKSIKKICHGALYLKASLIALLICSGLGQGSGSASVPDLCEASVIGWVSHTVCLYVWSGAETYPKESL